MFINSDSVFFDFSKNIENMWLSCMGCTVCRIGNPFWFADGFTGVFPVLGNDSNLLIVFYVQIMPDDFVMQLHRF